MFQPTGLFCLVHSDGGGWIPGEGQSFGRLSWLQNICSKRSSLKLCWFSSLGCFEAMSVSAVGEQKVRVMGEFGLDKVLLM